MNLDHDFAQVSVLNEDQKKEEGLHQKWNTLFPKFRRRPKKRGLHQKWNTFFPEFKWTPTLTCTVAHQSQIIEGDADVDHTQTIEDWGGYSQIIVGCSAVLFSFFFVKFRTLVF